MFTYVYKKIGNCAGYVVWYKRVFGDMQFLNLMRVVDECFSCVAKRAKYVLDRGGVKSDRIFKSIELKLMQQNDTNSWISSGLSPAQLGTIRQHILTKHGFGNTYQKEKGLGRKIGYNIVQKYLHAGISQTLKLSIILNGLEFDVGGVFSPQDIEFEFESELNNMDTSVLEHHLLKMSPGTVLFLLDNVGEHLADSLLMIELQKLGWLIVAVVRGGPVLNDVTSEDVHDLPPDIEILETGKDDVGIFLNRISNKLKSKFDKVDLIISKGMANFETLSREKLKNPCIYMFKAKCDPVADVMNVQKGEYVWEWVDAHTSLL